MTSQPSPLQRGDVVLVVFPFTDLSGSKRRPAIVINIGAHQDDVIFAFVSSVVPPIPISSDLVIRPSDGDFSQTGLKKPSVVRLNKLATLHRRLIRRRLGRLSTRRLLQIDDALVHAVGIDVARFAREERRRLAQIARDDGVNAALKAIGVRKIDLEKP